jgi:hypothetical protein
MLVSAIVLLMGSDVRDIDGAVEIGIHAMGHHRK